MVTKMADPPKRKRKPGAGRPKGAEPPRRSIAAFKGSEAFAQWFDGLVEHCRMPTSTVIEHALILLAQERGYLDPPPKR
jgi:hypothetical protein